jgi:large subunit ribosomal protein L10
MPNMLNELLVDQYERHFGEVADVVVIDYSGLNSEKMAEFRNKLRSANLSMTVLKNRLAFKALKDKGVQPLLESEQAVDMFRGPTAIIYGAEGAIDAAKFTVKWLKDNDKTIKLKGGQMGAEVLDEGGVRAISTLPNREELLSQMAGGFLSVPQKLAGTMQAGYGQVLWAFKALEEKLEQQG